MGKTFLLAALALVTLAGCGSGDMGYVDGTVTMDGKPLPNATVEFFPKGSGGASAGRTDENGYYELYLGRSGKGALKGEHMVQISTGGAGGDDGAYSKSSKEVVPKKYNMESELTATVEGGSQTIDFELDSEGEIIQPPTGY